MNWYFEVIGKYAQFSGRASRSEYWMFTLVNLVIALILYVGGFVAGGPGPATVLLWIYILAVLLPSWAVSVRRLHDTNRSGWWLLISFVPLASLVLLFFYVLESTPGTNNYGPNPWGEGEVRQKAPDQRLKELDSLRLRALISEEEYQEKRSEVLREV